MAGATSAGSTPCRDSGGEETGVRVEIAVEVDPSVGEEACDHLVRFRQTLDRLLGLPWRHVLLLQQCVRGVTGPESQIVKELERAQELVEKVLRKELVAPTPDGDPVPEVSDDRESRRVR
jgi:hypothetical protein